MSTTSIIAITAVVALFLVLLISSAIVLVWLLIRQDKTITQFTTTLHSLIDELTESNLAHRESMVQSLSTHSSQLQLLSQSISSNLDSHYGKISHQVELINGQALIEAIAQFKELVRQEAQAATRIERAAIAIGDLARALISDSAFSGGDLDRARESGLGPESYAPPAASGQPDISRSRTAAGDERDLAEEAEDNSFGDQ